MAAEGTDRPAFAPTLPGDALPRQRHRLIFSHDRGSGGRVAPVTSPGPCPGLRYCGGGCVRLAGFVNADTQYGGSCGTAPRSAGKSSLPGESSLAKLAYSKSG